MDINSGIRRSDQSSRERKTAGQTRKARRLAGFHIGADDGIRTRDPHLGKLRHTIAGAAGKPRRS